MVTPFFLLQELVRAASAGSAADRVLLSGARAVDGGVGAARAVCAGAAGNLGGGSLLASLRHLNPLVIQDEDGFLLPAVRAFPLTAAGVGGLAEMLSAVPPAPTLTCWSVFGEPMAALLPDALLWPAPLAICVVFGALVN